MGRSATCSSSSIDSSSSSTYSSTSLHNQDLSTDLRLGLSISSSQDNLSSTSREHRRDWPPIKPLLRRTLADGNQKYGNGEAALFVKVYMEGIPIGRKLDLFSHHGYSHLITTLSDMFRTPILCPDVDLVHSGQHHVLTYEDKDGDWMMVGDVPWELFLTTVKRLKITRADRC